MIDNPNQHIEKYLDDFLKRPKSPRFAVLLKGDWGCGKTWFIKNYRQRRKENDHSFNIVYVSLFGLGKLSEINEAIFSELNPLLDKILSNKGIKITTSLARAFLKGTIPLDFDRDTNTDVNMSISLPEFSENIGKSKFDAIVFDDLERCQINTDALFGYINQLVEVDTRIKVVIIANESKIQDEVKENQESKKSSYFEIKEKLIGKTFEIQYDINSSIHSFINEVTHQEVRSFLQEKNTLIIDLFNKGKHQNLRVVRQIMFDFERIYIRLPEKVQQKIEIVEEILSTLTILSIEIASNSIKYSEIKELMKANFGDLNPDKKLYADILKKYNYDPWKLASSCPDLDWWIVFFEKGIIDEQILKDITKSSTYFWDENTPAWQKLWHHTELTDEGFKKYQQEVYENFQNRKYTNLKEFRHVIGLLLLCCEMGVSSCSKEDVVSQAKEYISYLKDTGHLLHSSETYHEQISHLNLVYQCSNTPEFQEIYNEINKKFQELQIEKAQQFMPNLLNIIQDDTFAFASVIHPIESEYARQLSLPTYQDLPIFQYLNVDEFTSEIIKLEPVQKIIDVINAIKSRYEYFPLSCEKFAGEIPFLDDVYKILENEIQRRSGRPSAYVLKKLLEDLKKQSKFSK